MLLTILNTRREIETDRIGWELRPTLDNFKIILTVRVIYFPQTKTTLNLIPKIKYLLVVRTK